MSNAVLYSISRLAEKAEEKKTAELADEPRNHVELG